MDFSELDIWNGTNRLEKMLGMVPADVVRVDFDETILDYGAFAAKLNESLPEDAAISLGICGEPLMHPFFSKFVDLLDRPWKVKTNCFGPGFAELRANAHLFAEECMGVTVVLDKNENASLIQQLRKVALLARTGYNIKIESPVEINPQWVAHATHGLIDLDIEVIESQEVMLGYARSKSRTCKGALACIGIDGGFYPCAHCLVANPLGQPVYKYGELGEPFIRKGRDDCKLRWCPLE